MPSAKWLPCPELIKKPALQLPAPKAWESDTFNSDNNYSSAGWAYKLGGEQLNSLIEKAISGNPSLLAMSERLIAQGEQATILGSKSCPLLRPKSQEADQEELNRFQPSQWQHFFYEQQFHFWS